MQNLEIIKPKNYLFLFYFFFIISVYFPFTYLIDNSILPQYLFYNTLFIIYLFIFLFELIKRSVFKFITVVDLFVCLFLLYSLIIIYFFSSNNDYLSSFHIGIFLLMYLTPRVLKFSKTQLYFIILSPLLIEMTVCILQYSQIIYNVNHRYVIGGVYGHPSLTACTIALMSSIFTSLSFYHRSLKTLLFTVGINLVTLFVLITLDCRSALLSFFVVSLYFALKFVKLYRPKFTSIVSKYIYILLFFTLSLISILVFSYKINSTFGRLYIWRKSILLANEKPVFGHGYSSFELVFNTYQKTLVKLDLLSNKEIHLADYTEQSFNQFIQYFFEFGLVGLILFISILVLPLLIQGSNSNKSFYPPSIFLITCIPLFLGWSIIQYMPFGILFFFLLGISNYPLTHTFSNVLINPSILLTIIFCFYVNNILNHFKDYFYYEKLQNTSDSIVYHNTLFKMHGKNYSLVLPYLDLLEKKNKFDEKIIRLQFLTKISANPIFNDQLGDLYFYKDNCQLAIKEFNSLTFCVPNRLLPKAKLIKCFYRNGDIKLGDSLAYTTLSTKFENMSLQKKIVLEEIKLLYQLKE